MGDQSIDRVVRGVVRRLEKAGIETAALDAEVLMRHVLGWNRVEYLLRRNEPLPDAVHDLFETLVERRLGGAPVAYLTGRREFLGLTFAVGPGALVPRPETELLVEWAVQWLAGRREQLAADVGTGSGAIAVGLHALAPFGSLRGIVGVDPSAAALAWAGRNAAALAPDAPVTFIRSNLMNALAGPVDLVLANLPYLTPAQAEENPGLAAEPRSALVSGDDGLDLIRALLVDLPRVLAAGGAAILELDPAQASRVMTFARARFPTASIAILPDLSGRDRFVTIER